MGEPEFYLKDVLEAMPVVDPLHSTFEPLADSWTIFNNSEDIPQMVAFMESGKIEILDSELFKNISKQKEKR